MALHQIKKYVVVGFLTFSLATVATAQTNRRPAEKPSAEKERVTDQEFIWKVAEGNYAQAQFAELILKQSQSDNIKSLAQMLVVDHEKIDQELATIMEANNISYRSGTFHTEDAAELGTTGGTTGSNPIGANVSDNNPNITSDAETDDFIATSLNDEHEQALKRMQVLKGAQLNKVYLQTVQRHHQNMLKLYENQLKTGQNVQLNDFAERQLPVLRGHLAAVEQMELETKPSSVEN